MRWPSCQKLHCPHRSRNLGGLGPAETPQSRVKILAEQNTEARHERALVLRAHWADSHYDGGLTQDEQPILRGAAAAPTWAPIETPAVECGRMSALKGHSLLEIGVPASRSRWFKRVWRPSRFLAGRPAYASGLYGATWPSAKKQLATSSEKLPANPHAAAHLAPMTAPLRAPPVRCSSKPPHGSNTHSNGRPPSQASGGVRSHLNQRQTTVLRARGHWPGGLLCRPIHFMPSAAQPPRLLASESCGA